MVRRSDDLDYILQEYSNRCERFPREAFEVVDAHGELVDVEHIKTRRELGSTSGVSEPVSETSDREVYSDSWDYTE